MNFVSSTRFFLLSFALGSLLLITAFLFLPQIVFWSHLGWTISWLLIGLTLFVYGGFSLLYRWQEKEAQQGILLVITIETLLVAFFAELVWLRIICGGLTLVFIACLLSVNRFRESN